MSAARISVPMIPVYMAVYTDMRETSPWPGNTKPIISQIHLQLLAGSMLGPTTIRMELNSLLCSKHCIG